MKKTDILFFELLRVSLGTQNVLSEKLTEAEWQEIYALSIKYRLTGIIFSGIEKLPIEYVPPKEQLYRWLGVTLKIESKNSLLDLRTRELTSLFAKSGMRTCVLKGQGTSLLYENPKRRSGGDIDLWVEGKRSDVLHFLKSKWDLGDVLMYHADAKIFDDVSVEIHYIPAFSYNPFRDYKYRKFFESEGPGQFQLFDENIGFAHSSSYFNAVYSIIHIFNHSIKNEIVLKQVVDYYYILKHIEDNERDKIMKTIKWMGLQRFAGGLMYIIQNYFFSNPDDAQSYLLCPVDVPAGELLMSDLLSNHTMTFNQVLLKHLKLYYSEVLWAPTWKLWHWCWRKMNN